MEGRPIILENGTMHQGSATARKSTHKYNNSQNPKIVRTTLEEGEEEKEIEEENEEYSVPSRIQILSCRSDSMSSTDNDNAHNSVNTAGLHVDYNVPSKNSSRRSSDARSESSYSAFKNLGLAPKFGHF